MTNCNLEKIFSTPCNVYMKNVSRNEEGGRNFEIFYRTHIIWNALVNLVNLPCVTYIAPAVNGVSLVSFVL